VNEKAHSMWSERTYLFRLFGLRSSSIEASGVQLRSVGLPYSVLMHIHQTPLTRHEVSGPSAHGGPVGALPVVTFAGVDNGHFNNPQMRLCNVLRAGDSATQSEND